MCAFKHVQTAQPLKVRVQCKLYSLLDDIQDTGEEWKRDVGRKKGMVKGRASESNFLKRLHLPVLDHFRFHLLKYEYSVCHFTQNGIY